MVRKARHDDAPTPEGFVAPSTPPAAPSPNSTSRAVRQRHSSITATDAVMRFRDGAQRITAAGAITHADERNIISWLQLRAIGVPGHLILGYQNKLRHALTFLDNIEAASVPLEMLLVVMAVFSRDVLVTMSMTTRREVELRIVAGGLNMSCPPMREWAQQHEEL